MTDYYIDPRMGNDRDPGLTPVAPWATLHNVPGYPFVPGDRVLLARGGVWDHGLTVNADDISVGAYGQGDLPRIEQDGRAVEINGYHVRLWDLEIVGGLSGIRLWGAHNLVAGCTVRDVVGENDGVGFWMLNHNNEVGYCTILNCSHPHPQWGCDGGAFEWFWYADDCWIHHNVAVNCCGFLEVGTYEGQGSARRARVEHNLSINNRVFSYMHGAGSDWGTEIEDFAIRYNTIVELPDLYQGYLFGGDLSGAVIGENVIYTPDRVVMP